MFLGWNRTKCLWQNSSRDVQSELEFKLVMDNCLCSCDGQVYACPMFTLCCVRCQFLKSESVLFFSAISSLETTVDRLSHQFERIAGYQPISRVRHAISTSSIAEAPSLTVDITEKQRSPVSPRIRTTSQLFQLPSAPNATPSSETWRMPFMFKCLGTLR